MDLADIDARRALLEKFRGRSAKALILSEGLLIYLSAQQVGTLARDLAQVPAFKNWIVDIASPGLLLMIQKNTVAQISEGAAQLQFAPENGPEFFKSCGWALSEVHSTLKTAARLKRLRFLLRLVSHLPEKPEKMGSRTWGGVCLLKNNTAA